MAETKCDQHFEYEETDKELVVEPNISVKKDGTSAIDSLVDLATIDSENKELNLPNTETIKEPSKETTPDVSLPTLQVFYHDDQCGEPKQVIDESLADTPAVRDDTKAISIPALEVSHENVKNQSSDVQLWNDGSPLPSTGHACSEWQAIDDVRTSGVEAISTQVLTAGCPPEYDQPRSGCVNIESVTPSEQVGHLPTSIISRQMTTVGCPAVCDETRPGHVNVESVMPSEQVSHLPTSSQVLTAGCPPVCDEPCSGPVNIDSVMPSEEVSHPPVSIISSQASTARCPPVCDEPRSECVNIESVTPSKQISHLPTSSQVLPAGCQPECHQPRSGCVNIESVTPSEEVSYLPTPIISSQVSMAGCPLVYDVWRSGRVEIERVTPSEEVSNLPTFSQVSTAGCPPAYDQPRSGCVNVESVTPLEEVTHLPTPINEDGANLVGNEGFPQFQNKVDGTSNDFNGIIGK